MNIISEQFSDGTLAIKVPNGTDIKRILVIEDRTQYDRLYYPNEIEEWCYECKEYDQENHCCHRFSKLIRRTVDEMQVVRCKDCKHKQGSCCDYSTMYLSDYNYCFWGEKKIMFSRCIKFCDNKTTEGYCKTTVCINPQYSQQNIETYLTDSNFIRVVRCKDYFRHNACKFEQILGYRGFCSQGEKRIDERFN